MSTKETVKTQIQMCDIVGVRKIKMSLLGIEFYR